MARHDRSDREYEREADRLIAESIRRSGRGEYPCYQERWMDELARREVPGIERVAAPTGGQIEARLAGMVVEARLTRRQRLVIRGLLQGRRQREIAGMLGISESQVCRIKQAAVRRMREAGVLPDR